MSDSPLSKKIRDSLGISWKEGIPATVMVGITDYYIVPFALFLGASAQDIGFLVAIPSLLASIAQLWAAKVVRVAGNRLRFLVIMAAAQAALLLPAAALPFFSSRYQIIILISLIVGFKIFGNWIAVAWGSLVSDYLPPEKRGHYFGWRSQVVGLAGAGGVVFAGILLFAMKAISQKTAFFLLFITASACRFFSAFLLSKMTDVPYVRSPGSDFTFFMFLRRFRQSNFVKFVLYVASIMFATQLAAPYFSVYMLRDLKFDYFTYMFIVLASVVGGLVSFPIWGKHADVVGNAKVLKTTSLIIPIIPVLWFFSKNPYYLMTIELFTGFIWGGFNLCATNFIFDSVSPAKRVRCLGYFSLLNGIAIFIGASIGGFLADNLPPLFGYSILCLFFISALLRLLAHFVLSKHFSEVRASAKHRISSIDLFFSVVGIRPLVGINQDWNVFPSIKPLDLEPEKLKP